MKTSYFSLQSQQFILISRIIETYYMDGIFRIVNLKPRFMGINCMLLKVNMVFKFTELRNKNYYK